MKNTPAKRALAVLDKPASDAVGGRKRISRRVTAAIDLMASGECKNIKETAERVGLARESLSRALSKPHVAEHLRTKVLRALATAAARGRRARWHQRVENAAQFVTRHVA